MSRCGTRRNVGGSAQSTRHEWRLLKEKEETVIEYSESSGVKYSSGRSKKVVSRTFYCVWCRKVVEDEA